MSTLFSFFLLCSTFLFCISLAHTLGNETDRLALLAFKSQVTSDPFRVMSSWNDSNHFCDWEGVHCGHRHQRVGGLDLSSRNLVGSISPHLGNLSFLREIVLVNNSFGGKVPRELGQLFRLEKLHLRNNSLVGKIPGSISLCSNLILLGLSHNNLVGSIPMELGSLSKLGELHLGHNMLTGKIPASLGNLTHLTGLALHSNRLGGTIPNKLGQVKSLTILTFGENTLSVVHCDLKPGNVLLGDDLTAHVSDFRFAKFLAKNKNSNTSEKGESSTIAVHGTMGYILPEYGMGAKVSIDGDIYSYGILLLEMFIGKKPTDHMFKDGLTLHDFSKRALPQLVIDIADSRMLSEAFRSTEASCSIDQIKECLSSVIKIGVACSLDLATDRRNIKDVLKEMHAIRETCVQYASRE